MTAPLKPSAGRFTFETHLPNGQYCATLPYKNAQGEFQLGSSGAQMRVEIMHRGYPQINYSTLYPGMHDLWIYDSKYSAWLASLGSADGPMFMGRIWDVTASSSTGTLSLSAQDGISELTKRDLRVNKAYSSSPESAMLDLFNYTNGVRALRGFTCFIDAAAGGGVGKIAYTGTDGRSIGALWGEISALGNGVEYFIRPLNGTKRISLNGGLIKPAGNKSPVLLEYGSSSLGQYALQITAQPIVNDLRLISSGNLVGGAVDTTLQTTYDSLFQGDVNNSPQSSVTDLNNSAAALIKGVKNPKNIPTIVTRATPMVDFDFGTQFQIKLNDGWVAYNDYIRVVGWQLTIGANDATTCVIYTNDITAVS